MELMAYFRLTPSSVLRGTLRVTRSSSFIEAHYRLATARFEGMSDTSAKAPGPDGSAAATTRHMQASNPNGTGALTYFRKGFGLKSEIQSELASDYTGHLVDLLQARDYTLIVGDVTIRLAKEFGFCYGVERAVEYAYQARKKFPDRTIYLAGEIIHNPHVNSKLQAMGIRFLLPGADAGRAGDAGRGMGDGGWGMGDAGR